MSCQIHPAFQAPPSDRRVKRRWLLPRKCQGCGEWFDSLKALVSYPIVPNTFGLPDRSKPLVECPHCGFNN